jgi:hypothetical protein
MVAAWAALRAGHEVTFYSNTVEKSTLYGCQYLHAPIPLPPEFRVRSTTVAYKLNGSTSEYRAKVYGAAWQGSVSPEDLEGEHEAWDIRATYDALWSTITKRRSVNIVTPVQIHHSWLAAHTRDLSEYAHVISTIPAMALCENPKMLPSQEGHLFRAHRILASGSTEPLDSDNEIICDGTDSVPWYRSASVFGYRTMEYPRRQRQIVAATHGPRGFAEVQKPLSNECDCHPEIIRMGRYGEWTKGVLVHHVFERVESLMNGEWA